MFYVQLLINGIILGGIYCLTAVGFSLQWGVMNLLNVAHGSLIMLGAYLTYFMFHLWGVDPFLSIPFSAIFLFIFGYGMQRYVINLLIRAPIFMTFLIMFALNMIITNIALLVFSGEYRTVSPSYASKSFIIFGSVNIPYVRASIFLVAVIVTVCLFWILMKTRMGRAIRASRMDKDAAELMGIKIGHIYATTFALGSAIAGVAGSLFSIAYPISPIMGVSFTFKAFIISVLGGLGNAYGALVGGLAFGLLEVFGATALGPNLKDPFSFLVFVAILILCPNGLVGKRFYNM